MKRLAPAVLLLALPGTAFAQTSPAWPSSEAELIALARTAAPPEISAEASVWVLRDGRFVRAVEGTNNAACIVVRDHPESVYPICYDEAGARSVLPIELREQELRAQGLDDDAIEKAIGAAIARGELHPPERGAVAYMMSPKQVLYASPTGPRVGQWHPHIMLYMPYANAETAGTERVQGFMSIFAPGTLRAHMVVIVNDWAKPPA